MSDAYHIDSLTRRLDALERENRRLRYAVYLVAALMAGASVLAAAATPLVANRVTLVDGQQHPRAVLDVNSAGAHRGSPMLTFYDQDSTVRLRVGIGDRGPILEVVDPSGRVRDLLGPVGARPATVP